MAEEQGSRLSLERESPEQREPELEPEAREPELEPEPEARELELRLWGPAAARAETLCLG